MQLALKYSAFAVIATLANLLAQEAVVQLLSIRFTVYIGLVTGTIVGLVCKYVLDKHYIFNFRTRSAQEDLHKFFGYGFTGVFTTFIFWSFELGFDYLFASKIARYLGACIGLSIGYGIKYQLDKRYVFIEQD